MDITMCRESVNLTPLFAVRTRGHVDITQLMRLVVLKKQQPGYHDCQHDINVRHVV